MFLDVELLIAGLVAVFGAGLLGRWSAPKEVVVEKVVTIKKIPPDNRVEAWFNAYDRVAAIRASYHINGIEAFERFEATCRDAGNAAVAAWDKDAITEGKVVRYPAACPNCSAPIAPLPSDKT